MLFFPTVDEDVQYFRSQGYTGSINDMHFKAMGDLGYTGSLNDRIHAYLTFTYGSYYKAMRDLRNGTSVFALRSYTINGFDPALVFDFKNNYFRKVATDSTFAASITHTASSNATMVDSDGLLKWRPHNLVYHSSDLISGYWSGGLVANPVTVGSPFGTYQTISPPVDSAVIAGSYQRFQINKPMTIGATYGGWALVKYSAGSGWFDLNLYNTGSKGSQHAWFDVQNGVVGSKDPLIIDHGMIDYGDGWWLCWATSISTTNSGGISIEMPNGDGVLSSSAADEMLIAGTQFYRSDLGGMVDSYTYVPTTSSLVYGPRVGHHIYNGSAWVNEGILHESEARTNLLLNSGTLSTQSATVVAVATTLSFTGTGTITLTGASTAGPLVGTGNGENNRVSLTFTPTAGTLTLSVSGTVTNAQLEAGSTPSSYIPTAGATVTRAADLLTVPAANLPYDSTNMSMQMDGKITYADTAIASVATFLSWALNPSNKIFTDLDTDGAATGEVNFNQFSLGVADRSVNFAVEYSPGIEVPFNISSRHGSTFVNGAVNGTAGTTDTTPTALPDLSSTDLNLGYDFMGTIGQFRMWDEDLTDAGIEEAST